jgi:hypothetical protein
VTERGGGRDVEEDVTNAAAARQDGRRFEGIDTGIRLMYDSRDRLDGACRVCVSLEDILSVTNRPRARYSSSPWCRNRKPNQGVDHLVGTSDPGVSCLSRDKVFVML